jgi:hypothetical protein
MKLWRKLGNKVAIDYKGEKVVLTGRQYKEAFPMIYWKTPSMLVNLLVLRLPKVNRYPQIKRMV